MKRLLLFSFISICIATASAQVINVPAKAQEQLQERYKGAKNIIWTNKVASYLATFKMAGGSYRAHYNIDGTWDYTEKFITKAQVDAKTTESFSKSIYRDWKLRAIALTEYANGDNLYRFEVKKGIIMNYVFFDKEGTLIKVNKTL